MIQNNLLLSKSNHFKIKLFIILIFTIYIINDENLFECLKNIFHLIKQNSLSVIYFHDLLNSYTKPKSILIFEPNGFHHECSPGFTKYFIDLGYNVDLLIHSIGTDSFSLFKYNEKIRLAIFNDLEEINENAKNLSMIIKNYDYILIQTTKKENFNLYNKIGFFNITNSIFVLHRPSIFDKNYFTNYFKNNRIWSLGNYTKGLQVNPHYFGEIKIKTKNDKIKFFLTSTYQRNYTLIIESSLKLKKENFDFELIVTGRSRRFNSDQIPKNLSNIFLFRHNTSYNELYKAIESSDYIIIPLDPKNKNDLIYKKDCVTGSIQLMYGFLKPAIIHEEFAYFYHLNNQNSLIYNNSNFYNIMKKAILIKNKDYKKLQHNLRFDEKAIYTSSINNIRRVINT